ncbi:hypothetical protein ACQUSR_12025 [Streptomyces sp. P1-3]|uniref:hypothetical protein n=1 Tax=Streptomyces sp. P1-3 TaxID=3421658 RepID=UPI003D36C411
MSQPPQPPNQPPTGGFGAPQDPPPGGTPAPGFGAPQPSYGYPQQPPGTPPPGYGYPQQPQAPGQPPQTPPPPGPPGAPATPPPAPPGAPAAPPQTPPPGAGGYGYPGQPAGGQPGAPAHAQPTQVAMPAQPYGTGQQQPYGTYPTQPQPQMPGGGPGGGTGGGGKSKQRLMIIVSAVVAVALIAAAAIFFLTKEDDPKDKPEPKPTASDTQGNTGGKDGFKEQPAPKAVDARLLGKIPAPKVGVRDVQDTEGIWATDKVFAKASVHQIVGYPANGGDKAVWKLPLDGEVCGASPHVNDKGQTAILFRGAKPTKKKEYPECSEVGLLDLNAGKLVWQKNAKATSGKVDFEEVAISGDTVAVGTSYYGGWAWSTGGDELWAPRASDECKDQGYAGGPKLVRVRQCGEYDSPQVKVERVDPKTGEPQSTYTVPAGIKDVHIASVDPLVIGVEAGETKSFGASDFFALDDSGETAKLRSKISTENGKYDVMCRSRAVEACRNIAVSRQTDTLFMSTESRYSSDAGAMNEVVAFSLATGKAIGKTDGVADAPITPLKADENGYVIAYQDAGYDRGGVLLRIDPKSYAKAVLMNLPLDSADVQNDFRVSSSDFAYVNERLYMGQTDVYDDSYKKPLAVAFGG